MEAEQYDRILERLLDDELLSEEVRDLVDAACRGDAALLEALEGKSQAGAVATKRRPDATTIPQVSLRSIEVRGFRGIGDTAELELQPVISRSAGGSLPRGSVGTFVASRRGRPRARSRYRQ